ncbi:zinc finger BED domain-containing protein RICESLEEPER 2 [Tanacetum coccineum]
MGDNSGSNLGKRKSVTSTTPKGKKVKAEGKEKSEWWQYYEVLYEKDEDGNRRKIAKCKYCETRLVADNENPMSNKELESKVEDMVEEVKTKMGELFGTYKERFDFLSSNSSMGEHMESEVTSPNNGDNDFLNDYYNVDATSSYETETELDRYLREPKIELRKGQSLDILQWWKVNVERFPDSFKNGREYLGNSNFNCGI